MDIEDFRNGPAFVVGLSFCFPPRYAAYNERPPFGWMWTSELTEAETFATYQAAERHLLGDMAGLVDGNEDVKVLKVEMKVSEAITYA